MIAENGGTIDSQAGDITINATNSVKLIGNDLGRPGLGTEINNHVGTVPDRRANRDEPSNASGNGGSIKVNTNLLEISDQARIFANSYDRGNSGNVVLNTNDIIINGGAFGSLIFEGIGDAGDVIVNNTNDVVLNEFSNIQSQVLNGGEGDVGAIEINTGSLNINEKFSFILADNISAGNVGNITINASDSVFIDGGGGEDLGETLSAIISQVQNDVVGNAGDITISAPELALTNFGLISSNVKEGSVGNTGNILLNVGTLSLNNGAVIDALTENNFDGGSVTVNANTVELINGGKIVTSGDRGGNAGSINLNVSDNLVIDSANSPTEVPFFEAILQDTAAEAGLFSSTVAATGNGGSITVRAGSIQLANDASILATTSSGTGGNVSLSVDDTIALNNNSLISAEADGIGSGGNVNINTNFIIASSKGNNDILANAEQGQGGNINITAEALLGIQERTLNNFTNDINASSRFNLDGNVEVDILNFDPIQGITELPRNVIEPGKTTAQACSNVDRKATANNNFVITGKGGIPTAPISPLNSANVIIDGQINGVTAVVPSTISTSQGKIQPARGLKVTKSGEVILTAYQTDSAGKRLPQIKGNCGV